MGVLIPQSAATGTEFLVKLGQGLIGQRDANRAIALVAADFLAIEHRMLGTSEIYTIGRSRSAAIRSSNSARPSCSRAAYRNRSWQRYRCGHRRQRRRPPPRIPASRPRYFADARLAAQAELTAERGQISPRGGAGGTTTPGSLTSRRYVRCVVFLGV